MAEKTFDFIVRLRDQFTASFRKLGKAVRGFGDDLLRISGISAAVSAALGALGGISFLRGAIQSAASFEAQLDRVQAVLNGTAEEMAAVEARAEELGASTKFTATEAAQGIEELARAGLSASEAIDTIGPALLLAQGNSLQLAEASQIVSTALNQFGLSASEAGRVADVLTTGAANSATTVTQLSNALNQSAPIARQAGLTIEETAAILGRLADQGFRGEKGGTALRNTLAQLADPTSKFSEELRKLGIDSQEPLDVLAQLAEKGDSAAVAIRALGLDTAPAITALVSSGVPQLQLLVAILNSAAGAAENAAAILESNLDGALDSLSSAFDGFRQSLVQPLLEPLAIEVARVAESLRTFAASDSFARIRDALKEAFLVAADAARQFVASIDFDRLAANISSFVESAAAKLSEFAQNAAEKLKIVADSFTIVGVVVNGVRVTIETLVAGAALALKKMTEASLTVAEAFQSTGLVTNAFQSKIDELKNRIELLDSIQIQAAENAVKSAERVRTGLASLVAPTETLTSATTAAGEAAGDAAGKQGELGEALGAVAGEAQGAADATGELVTAVGGAGKAVGDAASASGRLGDSLETQATASGLAADEARRLATQLVQSGASAEEVEAALASIGGSAEDAANGLGLTKKELRSLQEQATGAESSLDAVSLGFRSASGAARDAAEGVRQAGDSAGQAAGEVINLTSLVGGVRSEFAAMGDSVVAAFDKIVDRIAIYGTSVQRFFSEYGPAVRKFQDQVTAANEAVADAVQKVAQNADGAVDALVRVGQNNGLLSDANVEALAEAWRRVEENSRRAAEAAEDVVDRYTEDLLRLQGAEEELAKFRADREAEDLRQRIEAERQAGNTIAAERLEQALQLQQQIAQLEAEKRYEEIRQEQDKRDDIYGAELEQARDTYDAIADLRDQTFSTPAGAIAVPPGGVVNFIDVTVEGPAFGDFEELAARVADYIARAERLNQ